MSEDKIENKLSDEEIKEKFDNAKKKLNNYTSIRRRLGTAIFCYVKLSKTPDIIKNDGKIKSLDRCQHFLALYDAMIVSYVSCFSHLDAKQIFSENADLLAFHEETVEIRNKIIAHNDSDNKHIINGFSTSEENGIVTITLTSSLTLPTVKGLSEFNRILEYTWDYTIGKMKKIISKLENETGKTIRFHDGVG